MIVPILFTIAMVGSHLPVALLWNHFILRDVDPARAAAAREAIRPQMIRLWVVWVCAVVGFAAWYALDWEAIAGGARETNPNKIAMVAFHVIWWPFVMPVSRKLEQTLKELGVVRGIEAGGPVRTASLQPRLVREYLPNWARVLPTMLGVTGVALIAVRLLQYPPTEARFYIGVGVFSLSGLALLVFYGFWIRREVEQSYPAAGQESATPEYQAAVEDLRTFRIRAVFWFQVLGAAVFFCAALLFLEVSRGAIQDSTAGIVGGGAGAALGCLGGVVGMVAGIRAHRIAMLAASPAESNGAD